MAFTAADVKNLREMTGVGMMDCKKALTETDGDMDKAVEYLREKGLAKAAKKAGRIAAEGVSYALVENGVGALVEVNCETDFSLRGLRQGHRQGGGRQRSRRRGCPDELQVSRH